jgi:hypothetical protein
MPSIAYLLTRPCDPRLSVRTCEIRLARTKDRPMGGYAKLQPANTVGEAAPWMDRAPSHTASAQKRSAATKPPRKSTT